jgi:ssDNA thymidine ADP-ribosyltransferase, DarT
VDRSQVGELFYIAPVANVASIMAIGILSHSNAARVGHQSVALNVIQEKRARVRVSPTRMLHDHANLYVCARNPMMFYVVHHNPIREVCLLRVFPGVLDLDDVVVTDGNASSTWTTRFDPPSVGIPALDYARVHARYWTHPGDQTAEWEHSRVKAAEVLVPESVDPGYIIGAYAPTREVASTLTPLLRDRDVRVASYPFFAGSGWR